MNNPFALVGISVVSFLLNVHGSDLINVNFCADKSTGINYLKTGKAAIGDSDGDFWNVYSRDNIDGSWRDAGTITDLSCADGAKSTVSLTYSGGMGAWFSSVPDNMYRTYLYNPMGSQQVTISNLAAGTYDLYIYAHGAADNQNSLLELYSGSTSFGITNTVVGPEWNSANWTEGDQYIVFKSVIVEDNKPINLQIKPQADIGSYINGIQIRSTGAPRAAFAPVVNVNFIAHRSLGPSFDKVGPAAFGTSAYDFWNNYSRDTDYGIWKTKGVLTNLAFIDASLSGISLGVTNLDGYWYNSSPDAMYSNYLYPLTSGGDGIVTLNGMQDGVYWFYVYGHGGADNQYGDYELQTGQTDLGPLATTTTSNYTQSAWQEGIQYVAFSMVVVSNNAPVTIRVKRSESGYAVISGIQVVKGSADLIDPIWNMKHFGTLTINDTTSRNADPDGDGASNYEEYLTGSDPMDKTSVRKLVLIKLIPQVTFMTVPGTNYQISRKSSITSAWESLEVVKATGTNYNYLDFSGNSSQSFYSIELAP
jgi:hypothetical protein